MNEAEALAHAASVRDAMQSDGWKVMRKILEDQVAGMDTLKGIASLKELQAKQMAHRALTTFLADLDAIRDATDSYVAEKAVRKITDPIFRVVQ